MGQAGEIAKVIRYKGINCDVWKGFCYSAILYVFGKTEYKL